MEKVIVYQNIEESTYDFNLGDFKFYFSSEFNLNRYKENVLKYITTEIYKLKNRYGFTDEKTLQTLKLALSLTYYKLIEKRGFRVYRKGERING